MSNTTHRANGPEGTAFARQSFPWQPTMALSQRRRPTWPSVLLAASTILSGVALLLLTPAARAGLAVPYAVDSTNATLHLWHFDEASGGIAYDAVSNDVQTAQLNMVLVGGPQNLPVGAPAVFTLQGQPPAIQAVGLGSSIQTTQGTCFYMPFSVVTNANGTTNTSVNGFYNTANVYPSPAFTNIANYVNTNTGAFTFEALIRPVLNPLALPYTAQLITTDNGYTNGALGRPWQFRINTAAQLEYIDIVNNGVSPDFDATAALPSSGPDAAVAGNWYHVAVTFTGTKPTNGDPPNVMTMYWTALDYGIPTYAHLLKTFTKTNNQIGTATFAIGGSMRNSYFTSASSSGGFPGNFDEVRISSVCRKSNDMAFNTNAVILPPIILTQPPANILIGYGQTLTLTPGIAATAPLTNTWTQNGVVIAVTTNASLVLSNVTYAANGTYVCHSTNATVSYGVAGTNTTPCVVTVGATFDGGPFGTGVDTNGNALDAAAPGSYDLHWQLVQSPDPNAVLPHAVVWSTNSPVSPNGGFNGDGANYAWIGPEENVASGSGSSVYQTSFVIDQTALSNAVLTANVFCGGAAAGGTFQINLNGTQTTYTMSGNPGAIATPIALTSGNGLQYGSNTLQIVVATSGLMINVVSNIGNAYPAGLPTISSQPSSETVQYQSAASFSVVALGAPPLSYQWYFNGAALNPAAFPGAASRVLTLSAANGDAPTPTSQGNYMVVVSNGSGSVTSSVVALTVNATPVLTSEPITYTNEVDLYAGASPTFSVTASQGITPYYYQWYSNNVALAGATNTSYALTNLPVGVWGSLDCVVTNLGGSVTGTVWNITAIPLPTAAYPAVVVADNPVGFWRLNESGNTVLAIDSWKGNNGIYTNAVLDNLQTQDSAYDPTEGSAGVGLTAFSNSDVYGVEGVNFATPTNNGVAFSVEAWVNSYQAQTLNAGIVNLGYQSNEQFTLDCGGSSSAFRFFVRDAGGAAHNATSTVVPVNGQWYHLVGVCDEAHGAIKLFINGLLAATNTVPASGGLLASTNALLFGARGSNAANNLQFVGYLDDISIYNYALTSTQVLNHYYAADIGATITSATPTTETVDQNGTATFTATVIGTPPFGYQWYDANAGNQPIPGAASNTLVLNNVQASDTYYLIVTNLYGTNQSAYLTLTVVSQPEIAADVLPQYYVPLGGSVAIPVTVYGELPLTYQWQVSDTNEVSWTNVVNNSHFFGAQTNVLIITNAALSSAGEYRLAVTSPAGSIDSSVANVIVGTLPITFNGAGGGWSSNANVNVSGSAYDTPIIANNVMTLTDGHLGETRSSFFAYPQYIGAFTASFVYQDVGGGGADGITFCVQNDPRGTRAMGAGGGDLGFNGINPSLELAFNIFGTIGYGVFNNGVIGSYVAPGSVSLAGGDPLAVTVEYLNSELYLSITDAVASRSFSTNLAVGNLTSLLGTNAAFVGFSGSDGGVASTQIISNFTFVSLPSMTIQPSGATVVLSWPSSILGYTLQQNPNPTTTNWVNVGNGTPSGPNQITVPASSAAMFYRLVLP